MGDEDLIASKRQHPLVLHFTRAKQQAIARQRIDRVAQAAGELGSALQHRCVELVADRGPPRHRSLSLLGIAGGRQVRAGDRDQVEDRHAEWCRGRGQPFGPRLLGIGLPLGCRLVAELAFDPAPPRHRSIVSPSQLVPNPAPLPALGQVSALDQRAKVQLQRIATRTRQPDDLRHGDATMLARDLDDSQ
jgi:hypothetical protein